MAHLWTKQSGCLAGLLAALMPKAVGKGNSVVIHRGRAVEHQAPSPAGSCSGLGRLSGGRNGVGSAQGSSRVRSFHSGPRKGCRPFRTLPLSLDVWRGCLSHCPPPPICFVLSCLSRTSGVKTACSLPPSLLSFSLPCRGGRAED